MGTVLLGVLLLASGLSTAQTAQKIFLSNGVILVDSNEPSFLQYGAHDLSAYLAEVSGRPFRVQNAAAGVGNSGTVFVLGRKMADAMRIELGPTEDLGEEGAIIRSISRGQSQIVVVAGASAEGTNFGIAGLMRLIHLENGKPYLDGPLNLRTKPRMAIRGLHLNGGVLNYPYGFRNWKEQDWKKFIDISWAHRANLILLWPFMEIMPVPLSSEDEAYLQEVRRIVDYAQQQRGIRVWIMHSTNRIGISDCGTRDPRERMYWDRACQQDLNPADSQQFSQILKSFEALYKNVNNADGFCMIDSDPGGWPQSPLSEQVKIFRSARQLLDRYNLHGKDALLVDWMWVGWGRRFLAPTEGLAAGYDWTKDDPGPNDVNFAAETVRTFKRDVPEPWELVAGFGPYLPALQQASVLEKTIYLPYAVVENDVFPATNLDFASVRRILNQALESPGLKGLMGNNQMVLLQFPSTHYFFTSTWEENYRNNSEEQTLMDVSGLLYPEHQQTVADAFLAMRGSDPDKINQALTRLEDFIGSKNPGKPGALGRHLFPDPFVVVRDLAAQLRIRAARQQLIKAMQGKPSVSESAQLVENYFDKLLVWNKTTGWDKLMDEGSGTPIYDSALLRECGCPDKELARAISRLKAIVLQGKDRNGYARISAFLAPISKSLMEKYSESSVMVGCMEPFKLALIQSP
jgi:hypothetical protein